MASDVPADLEFIDPDDTYTTYRVVLFGAAGVGKSVAAASAPDPIVVLSADRPTAYKFSRRHFPDKDIRESKYVDHTSLDKLYRYLQDHPEVKTVVLDPVTSIVDDLVDSAPKRSDGDPDFQAVNKKMLGLIKSLRSFDVNVVLVCWERINDGKRGDGKLYPHIGGFTLIKKVMGEMDVAAYMQRHVKDDGEVQYIAQLQPTEQLECKESLGVLGERRVADLSRWFEVAEEAYRVEPPDDSDVPFDTKEPTDADLDAQAAVEAL